MLPTKYWAEMGWRDFAAADMSKVVAVLPVAAIEQHGPHLPVGVDTFINQGYLRGRSKRVPADWPVLFLPVQAIGKSNEHIEFPGTLTFSHRDRDARLVRDRRERRAYGLPQDDLHQFARRQRADHRHRGARTAGALQDARGSRRLASARLSRGDVVGAKSARMAFTAATPRPR